LSTLRLASAADPSGSALLASASGSHRLLRCGALPCCRPPTYVGDRPSGSAILEPQPPALAGPLHPEPCVPAGQRLAPTTNSPALPLNLPPPAFTGCLGSPASPSCRPSDLRRRPALRLCLGTQPPTLLFDRLSGAPSNQPSDFRRRAAFRRAIIETDLRLSSGVASSDSSLLPPVDFRRRSTLGTCLWTSTTDELRLGTLSCLRLGFLFFSTSALL